MEHFHMTVRGLSHRASIKASTPEILFLFFFHAPNSSVEALSVVYLCVRKSLSCFYDPCTAFLNAACVFSQTFTNVDLSPIAPLPISLAISHCHLQAHRARVTPRSALHAAALALHCLLVTEGCVCTGQDDKAGAIKGFAAPVRDIPEEKLVPDRW